MPAARAGFGKVIAALTACPDRPAAAHGGWWESIWLWLALAGLSTLPFVLADYPPMSDLMNHIGRYHIMLNYEHSALLRRYYEFHWVLVPNLGQDLLMVPVGAILGPVRGAILLTAIIPPIMILGMRQLSLEAHGRVQPSALLALPFSYTFTFLFGFVNYHFGLALLMWAMALWFRLARGGIIRRAVIFAILSPLFWVVHLSVWAFLLLAAGSFELVHWIKRFGFRPLKVIPPVALATLPMLLPVLLMLGGSSHSAPFKIARLGEMRDKIIALGFTLRDEWQFLDLTTAVLLLIVPLVLMWRRKILCDCHMLLFGAITFALYWIIPTALMNGFYADLRLLPMVWISVLLSCRVADDGKSARNVALFGTALFVVRMAFTTYGWIQSGKDMTAELHALDGVPRGARIAQVGPTRPCFHWENIGVAHLGGMAIVKRDAFSTSEWDIPGQQMMQPLYARGTDYNSSTFIKPNPAARTCGTILLDDWFKDFPRQRFDYIWIFEYTPPPSALRWLKLQYQGPHGRLYAVK